ncbi:MAG: N-6 DNA methylase [Chloroflexota bacterium]|nr:N-6 DNA methylase [Chloroflexota bacterium]
MKRIVRETVSILYTDARSKKGDILNLTHRAKEVIAREIESLAQSASLSNSSNRKGNLSQILRASAESSQSKAVSAFLYRAAFFAMTRILLVLLWEKHDLVNKSMLNSTTQNQYEKLNREIRQVLKYAFNIDETHHHWLFNRGHNYAWYSPDNSIVSYVMDRLSRSDLSKYNGDFLGPIYAECMNRIDQKSGGQYYTPIEVISFIWDRVEFSGENALFRLEQGQRKPRLIFDPATGSGGFLVEAAHRMTSAESEASDRNVKASIMDSLCGAEIQSFPHYITQVNILIQLTPLVDKSGGIDDHQCHAFPIVNQDSLSLHNHDNDASLLTDKPEDFIRDCQDFDYVCSNPPYIGEKGNKSLFRATIERYTYWRQHYVGKMDYFYWFAILGLSKLREGGKLGFITTSYWPTADGAAQLREYILNHAIIREIIDFGPVAIFEDAPGQHSMIFIMERSKDSRSRDQNRIKIARVKKALKGNCTLKQLLDHLEMHIAKTNYKDDLIDVYTSSIEQGALTRSAWNLMPSIKMDSTLERIAQAGTPLGEICSVNQGIISGADKVTFRNIGLLSAHWIATHNIKVGDGIFVITQREMQSMQLNADNITLIKPLCKNSEISRYGIESGNQQFLIYTTKQTDLDKYPAIKAHLEKFRPILENKREFKEGKLPWFSLHWARDQKMFEGAKIITPNRALKNTFAFSDTSLYSMSDVFFITNQNHNENPIYILGLLNSSTLEFWCSGNRKGKGWAGEFVGTPLSQIPIRRIDFNNLGEAETHDLLVKLIEEIIEIKKASTSRSRKRIEQLQREIDTIAFELYGLNQEDVKVIQQYRISQK